jgi:23S rRNA (guanosine2251-2'-O)-methyltransferase
LPQKQETPMARNDSRRPSGGGWTPDGGGRGQIRQGPRRRAVHADDNGPVWLWGTHAVAAALANPDRDCLTLLATENALPRLTRAALSPEIVTARELDNRLPPGAVHQGIALRAEPLEPVPLAELMAADVQRVVVLDQVSDPHNLGAIFRSAAAFGFGGLILQTRGAPPITGVVAKSAAGAVETVREVRVVNISRTLEELAEAGFHTVGLAGEATRRLADAVGGAGRLAIVLGAEGTGLRPAVANACAELARIPIQSAMESLNVSNAAAIAFYEACR